MHKLFYQCTNNTSCCFKVICLIVLLIFVLSFLAYVSVTGNSVHAGEAVVISVKSPAFGQMGMIPSQYTCDGKNMSPTLTIENVPANAKSLALIVDDPDAPAGTWVHWVMYDIPPQTKVLKAGISQKDVLPDGSVQGINDFHKIEYGGPCPPNGKHRYFFKLYALNKTLNIQAGASKTRLLTYMEGHIVGYGELIGQYKR